MGWIGGGGGQVRIHVQSMQQTGGSGVGGAFHVIIYYIYIYRILSIPKGGGEAKVKGRSNALSRPPMKETLTRLSQLINRDSYKN